MKRLTVILLAMLVMAWSVPSYANTSERFRGGFKRVVTAPFQVSDNMRTEGANAKFLPFGLTGGFLKGCFYMIKELISGTVDMAASPVDMDRRQGLDHG